MSKEVKRYNGLLDNLGHDCFYVRADDYDALLAERDGLLEWAVERWHAEVANRPLINVHRRSLDDTWRQIIRHLGGDTGLLCGPDHSTLLALQGEQP